jgi:glycosyltransferase involved in cell wall biosynthesis
VHILLLAECFTPEPVVGAFRIRKLAEAFAARGDKVTVVVALAGGATQSGIENVHLEVEPIRPSPYDTYQKLRSKLQRKKPAAVAAGASAKADRPSGNKSPTTAAPARNFFKSFVTSAIHLPDDRQGVIPSLLQGVRNVEHRGPFDIVYSSAPSFSVHLAARMVARRLGLPWFIEFRDAWRDNAGERPVRANPVVDRLDRYLEASCLRAASAVVAVSESAGESFRRRPEVRGPVLVALNGIEHVRRTPREARAPHRSRLVYAGSLYPPRDPRPVLESIARCVRRDGSEIPEFVFVGHCAEYDGESLAAFAERHQIGEHFKMIPWLPQAEAQRIIASADLALLPAQQWMEQIPNKLFDYLGCRMPILALANPGSETARLLHAVGGHFVVESTEATHADPVVLAALQASRDCALVGDETVLESMTVANQFTALTEEVANIFQTRLRPSSRNHSPRASARGARSGESPSPGAPGA